ncbi:hypothetical protein [Streptomyces sp. NPDC050548]|uniref:hypothetical protein n=1 Tax=Streptomyces sp. NPDC050548 TaxID=3365629 RepID=UPI0037A9EB8B
MSIALLTEGLSDQWFLLPLIDRQVAALEPESAPGFDFGGTAPGSRFTVAPRDDVVKEVALLLEHMDIVLIHHDHNERGKVESVRARLGGAAADRLIGIVPVRETEAWMLADAAALPRCRAADRDGGGVGTEPDRVTSRHREGSGSEEGSGRGVRPTAPAGVRLRSAGSARVLGGVAAGSRLRPLGR